MTRTAPASEGLRPLSQGSEQSDPDLAFGARLLERVGSAPRSEHRKRRVWSALGSASGSRTGFRLRTLHLAFAGLLFAAGSSAAINHYYVAPSAAEPTVTPAPPAAPRVKHPSSNALPRPARQPAVAEPVTPAAPPAVPATQAAARSKAEPASHGKAQTEAEAQLLVEAMRARRAGDSKRVSELVDEYRAKHPQGALQEEALILSIESAVARHAPNTSALSREYLARFPGGRFAEQATRALTLESR